jgi:hypothetical protein
VWGAFSFPEPVIKLVRDPPVRRGYLHPGDFSPACGLVRKRQFYSVFFPYSKKKGLLKGEHGSPLKSRRRRRYMIFAKIIAILGDFSPVCGLVRKRQYSFGRGIYANLLTSPAE